MSVIILVGDVFARLAELPDESIDCVVTSPPYWGLRDYGVDGQIGLEPTLGEHLDVMVRVFREVRRVLKKTGTLWLNYGDRYATSASEHFKCKDLLMMPNRLAIALQDDGWLVRSEIIWHKPNPMPESAKDRPTSAHEKVFLCAKSERYFYNADAIREGFESSEDANTFRGGAYVKGARGNSDMGRRAIVGNTKRPRGWDGSPGSHGTIHREGRSRGVPPRHEAYASCDQGGLDLIGRGMGRNARNVWTIATKPFPEAHFATFPPELAERCLQAGCPKGGAVLDPFGGAGTVGLVGDGLGLSVTLIELNPEYAEIARRRIASAQGPMFSAVQVGSAAE